MALSKKYRVVSKSDFDKIFKEGKAVRGSFLFIKGRPNERGFPRFGLIIPKKVYSGAVDRNRVRRVLFEIAKAYINNNITNSRDFIITVNKKGQESLIKNELSSLLR